MGFFSRFGGPPSQDKFAKLVMSRLRRAGVQGPLRYDRPEFAIIRDEEGRYFLGNAYAEYCRADKEGREVLLQRFLMAWASVGKEPPTEFKDAKPDLFPIVRARSYYEIAMARLDAEGGGPKPAYSVMGEHLTVGVVYDMPTCTLTVTDKMLDQWGVTFYEALEVAKQNLLETTKSYAQIGSLYSMVNGDSYDASRLALTDLVEGLEVDGEHIVMVPNRETLLIAGSNDVHGLEAMLKLGEEAVQHERYISAMAFRLHQGDCQPWLPELGHSLYDKFRHLQLQAIGTDYHSQAEMLRAQFEREGKDLFVASFSAAKQQSTGDLLSYTLWPKDVPTLIPCSDVIVLAGPNKETGNSQFASGRWEDVERVVGYLMQVQEMYPKRVLVEGWPTPEELALIGNFSFN